MLSLLESKEEIAKAQQKLEVTVRRKFRGEAHKNIGFPGGTVFDANVSTDDNYWFYSSDCDSSDVPCPRRLNWFGLFRDDTTLHITVEINTTYEGRNDRLAGFFARDNETGLVYLLHSGRVGGGKKGVGKTAFLAWSNQRLIEAVDSFGDIREGVLVMPIEGKAACRSAIRYIDIIANFKQAVREGELDTPELQRRQRELGDFYAESRGRRKGRRSEKFDYLSRHGDIVDALYSWRSSTALPKGGRLVKDIKIDLGVATGRKLIEVFEVKTSTARSDIYAAIGQLLVHGVEDKCRRVMVLPHKEPIAPDLKDALQRLGIELLWFKLGEEKATIV